MPRSRSSDWKVGLLILLSLAIAGVAIFLIGEQSQLFTDTNGYNIYFQSVSGLNEGNPVQLNGVNVGSVKRVTLPTDAEATEIQVQIEVEERYAERIRLDSLARIKTLGLLGDKYIEISAGSVGSPLIPPGGVIPTAPATNVDRLMTSGEDVMDNVVQISSSLKNILKGMEEGEGLLGELTTDSETGRRVTDAMIETMETVQRVAEKVDTGTGPLPRLINDAELANRMTGSVTQLEALLVRLQEGEGLVPSLLNDPGTKERFDQTLAQLEQVSGDLAAFSGELRQGDGLLGKLVTDKEYSDEITREIDQILERINRLTVEVTEGEGTVPKLINDPAIYDAVNDIVIGINESRLLRWLIRNRQQKGIEARYRDVLEEQGIEPEAAPPTEAAPARPSAPSAPPVDDDPPPPVPPEGTR